jgi:hypothetical protein
MLAFFTVVWWHRPKVEKPKPLDDHSDEFIDDYRHAGNIRRGKKL